MKLELTPEEYQNLIRLAYLGEWMANSNNVDYDDMDMDLVKLKSKLLSQAKEAGVPHWAEYRTDDEEWEETPEFIDLMEEEGWIDNYNKTTAQEEIINTAAETELLARIGHDAFNKLSDDELEQQLYAIRERILAEMEQMDNPETIPDDPSILRFPEGN